jgi:ADP-ribosylation factor GTPase-activating protein 2/3
MSPTLPVTSPIQNEGIVSPKPQQAVPKKADPAVARLGLSMQKLAFGQTSTPAAATKTTTSFGGFGSTSSSPSVEDETFARANFASQKAISSDQYFGRNDFDPHAASEAKSRLNQFEGATSISSNAYFGREEADEEDMNGDGNYGNTLENTARDFARRFAGTAGDDLQNLKEAFGDGASRMADYMRDYLR